MRLARKLGINRIVIPRDAGVGSAHGFLDAPIAYEVVRTLLARLDRLEPDAIDRLFDGMREEATAVVRLGAPSGDLVETRTAYMRYRGQGHEIAVPLPASGLDPAALRAAFDQTYGRLFGRVIPKLEVEAVTWTLSLSQPSERPIVRPRPAAIDPAEPGDHWRIVDSGSGEVVDASVHERETLLPGMAIPGPVAIIEAGTTTIVPSGFTARIAADGEIVIEGGAA